MARETRAEQAVVSRETAGPAFLPFGEEPPPDLGAFSFPVSRGTAALAGRDDLGRAIPHVRNEATARVVSALVACGATDIDIAVHLDIRPGQLRASYAHELEHGAFPHSMQVAKAILDRAKLGDPRFALFWAKARMGWKENDDKADAPEDESLTVGAAQLKLLVRGAKA